MKNDTPPAKIHGFDFLRAAAILILMFHHGDAYGFSLLGYPLEGLNPYLEGILLGIFFFISGYFSERSFQKQNRGSVSFFLSRLVCVYPPYLMGLALFIFVLGISFKKRDLFVYLLHRPLWAWLAGVFSFESGPGLIFFRLFPAIIAVFILSYYLQYGYDRLSAMFRRRE